MDEAAIQLACPAWQALGLGQVVREEEHATISVKFDIRPLYLYDNIL
jgi:hypothetical protein